MSPRLNLRAAVKPLVMAGALWAGGAGMSIAIGDGTPPPCGPDGVCVPRPHTFGWYRTTWRTFPGDSARPAPTPAAKETPKEEELGGPKEPSPAEEGLLGPAKAPRTEGAAGEQPPAEGASGAEAAEDPAAAGLGTLPGEVPLPGIELPGAQPAAPGGAPGGAAPAATDPSATPQPAPGAQPETDPLDPFGAAPASPPWLTNATQASPVLGGEQSANLAPADLAAFAAEAADAKALDGPNLYGDDAPPMLPATLRGVRAAAPARRTAPPQARATAPTRGGVHADRRVAPASANEPAVIQLVNPAAAQVDAVAEGPQQAIYIEASDQ